MYPQTCTQNVFLRSILVHPALGFFDDKKVKASRTRYRTLCPELIPVLGSQPAGDRKSSTRR